MHRFYLLVLSVSFYFKLQLLDKETVILYIVYWTWCPLEIVKDSKLEGLIIIKSFLTQEGGAGNLSSKSSLLNRVVLHTDEQVRSFSFEFVLHLTFLKKNPAVWDVKKSKKQIQVIIIPNIQMLIISTTPSLLWDDEIQFQSTHQKQLGTIQHRQC